MADYLFYLGGKVIVITGALGGFGRIFVPMLAKAGADIALADIVENKKAKDLVKDVSLLGKKAVYYKCNVSDEKQVTKFALKVLKDFGRVDILVNNAGAAELVHILDMKTKQFDNTVDTSLKGTFLCSREFGKIMHKLGSGRIINIASTAALIGLPRGTAHHSAAKAGVLGFTRAAAVEWAKKGITVNAIAPGQINTPPLKKIMENKEYAADILRNIPAGRIGEPEEIAAAIIFLSSDSAAFITGQTLVIDGGATVF